MSEAAARWIVTGMSGAGKATALAALERRGMRCIDNLPPVLLAEIDAAQPTAVCIDARQGADALRGLVPPAGWRVLFLDARDDVLVRRAGESTRPHPCGTEGGPAAAVRAERVLLEPLRAAADVVVDSSERTAAQLGEVVDERIVPARSGDELQCTVSSFGFKYGLQAEADWVVDARFLRNPFWDPQLRPLTGRDRAVREYVMEQAQSQELLERLVGLFTWTTERAALHGRSRVHIAVGCTGGRHRSVVLAEALTARLRDAGLAVTLRHRDVERPDPR